MNKPHNNRIIDPAQFPFSWYWCTGNPEQIAIGPATCGDSNWHELAPVYTPRAWWSNPFYMDAECRCVMNAFGLTMAFSAKEDGIHYSNINIQVPDITCDPDIMTIEYIKWFEERKAEYKRNLKRK